MSKHEFDTSTPEEGKLSIFEKFDNLNATKINENSMENALIDADMTFNVKRLSCQTFHENSNSSHNKNINNNNSKLNASSLRQELLEEVERSGKNATFSHDKEPKRELNMTYKNSIETLSAPVNYYKTYKKEGLKKIDERRDHVPNEMIDRFQTFRKSTGVNSTFMKQTANVDTTFSKNDQEILNATYTPIEHLENVNATFLRSEKLPEKIDSTFCKPSKGLEIVNKVIKNYK